MRRLIAALALLAATLAGSAAPVDAAAPWSMSVTDGAKGWAGTPTCGGGSDSPDHVIVDPTGGAFFSAELAQGAEVAADNMRSRVTVAHNGKQRWYNLVLHGAGGPRLLSTVEQAFSFNLTGSKAPVPSMPSIGRSARIDMTVVFQTKTGASWSTKGTCRFSVVVWAAGDPKAPASAVRLADVRHPEPHAPAPVEGLRESFLVRKYPGGEHYPVACDGTSPHVTRELEGSIRMEPGAGGRQGHPDHPVLTSDVWVFQDFGAGREFDWRQRSPNVPTVGQEFSQSGNPVAIRLPGGGDVDDFSPVTWTFQGHLHVKPDHHDTDGLICSSTVTVK